MNMHRASRLGWTRSLTGASSCASAEAADPPKAHLAAASGRAPVPASAARTTALTADTQKTFSLRHGCRLRACRSLLRSRGAHRGGVFLLAAALLVIPGLAFADVPIVSLSGPEAVVEGGTATFTVKLSEGFGSAPITISYEVTGTATEDVDYTAPTGEVVIDASVGQTINTTKTFVIAITADDVQEVGETLTVTLTGATTDKGMVALGSQSSVTTMIRSAETVLVSVQDARATETDASGAQIEFTVGLIDPNALQNSDTLTIGYKIGAGSATEGADYTAPEAGSSVQIALNATSQTFSVPIAGDMLTEADETFTVMLTLEDAPNGVEVAFARAMATGTIDDDDDLTASVTAQRGTADNHGVVTGSVIEGSATVFTVSLDGGTSTTPVVVSYTTEPPSTVTNPATVEDDYEKPSGTISIPAGESTGTITITTLADELLEANETLTVTLLKSGTTTAAGTVAVAEAEDGASAMATIGDSGRQVSVSIADIAVDEGDEAVFTARLSGKYSGNVDLTYMIGGTVVQDDYTDPTNKTVTIVAGMESTTFTVKTRDDVLAEGPETLTVTLTSAPPAGVGFSDAQATATINDENVLVASVSGPTTVPEGSPAVFIVDLDGGFGTADVIVDYQVGGTAVEGVDYEAPSGKLTFLVDDTDNSRRTFEIDTRAVGDDAAGETLTVRLTNATTSKGTALVGTPSEATTTTTPEDTVTVSVAAADGKVNEGESEEFTVTLTGGDNTGQVVVNYRVGGDVTADDFNESPTGTVTIPPNSDPRTRTFTLAATADSLEEPAETMSVTLSLPADSDAVLGTSSASATIMDQDSLTAAVTADQQSVNEGDPATFTVTLGSATSTADVVISYRVGGDEVNADDYEGSAVRTLTIPAGVPSATIEIQTANDNHPESSEDLKVTLTEAVTGGRTVALAGALENPAVPEEAMTTILANDGEILVSVAGAGTVAEGADAVFTVTLSGTVSESVEVQFDTEPSNGQIRTEAEDFTAVTGRILTFSRGMTAATVAVSTTHDERAEGDESFTAKIAGDSLPPGVKIGTARSTATIRDDDPLRVSVTADRKTLPTTATSATFTLNLTKANGAEGMGSEVVTVSYTVDGAPATKDIAAGTETDSITVGPATGWSEGDSVVIRLTGVSTSHGRVTLGTRDASTTSTDPDTTVGFAEARLEVEATEGNDLTFTVSRDSTAFTGDVRVRYTTEYGSATSADLTPASGILTIPQGQSNGSIVVKTRSEELAENNEKFTVRLLSIVEPTGSLVAIRADRATGTINNDDNLNAEIKSEQASVLEGSPAKFTVTLTRRAPDGPRNGAGSEDIVVGYVLTSNSLAKAVDGDFTAPSGRLTIRAGQSSGTITIDAKDDGVLEVHGELLELMLDGEPSTAAGDVDLGSTTEAQTTIRDLDGTILVSLANAGTVTEGRPAVFNLSLSSKYTEALTANFTTPTTGYTAPQPLTIPAGETKGSVTVLTIDDRIAEDEETLALNLGVVGPDGAAVPSYVRLVNTSATATITDNDTVTAVLSGPSAVSANEDAKFTVTLSGAERNAAATVRYEYQVEGEQLTTATNPPSIDADANEGTITVLQTALTAAGKRLTVTLTEVDTPGRVSLRTARVTVPIVANTVSLPTGLSDLMVTEPPTGTGSATFTVTRYGDISGSVEVGYVIERGTATTADYTATSSGTLNFSGQTEAIPISILADDLVEGDEHFTVRLTGSVRHYPESDSDPTVAVRLGTDRAKVTIKDHADDSLSVKIESQQNTVIEGSVATFIVTLTGEERSTAPVVVNYDYNAGSAKAEDGDFTAPSGTLRIPAGATTGTIAIRTLDDGILDRGETLTLRLKVDAEGPTTSGLVSVDDSNNNNEAETTIADAGDGVRVSVSDTTTDEGEKAMFTVALSGTVSNTVQVSYRLAPSGVNLATEYDPTDGNCEPQPAGSDYCDDADGPLTFSPSETTKTITVITYDDEFAESSETFDVTLSGLAVTDGAEPVQAGVSLGDFSATATITDDALTATLRGPTQVREGDGAEYTVSLTGFPGEANVVVNFDVTGTATAGQDYSPASGAVTIAAGERSATFTIQTTPDNVVDLRETMVVALTGESSDADTVRAEGSVTTTIVDDGTVEISLEADRSIVVEGQDATFTVSMSGTVGDADVILRYSTGATADTAAGGQDYTAVSNASLTIAAGQSSGVITVATDDDGQDELTDETFSVTLVENQQLPEGVQIAAGTATVTITDHALEASVTAPATVNEGQSVTYTVTVEPNENRSGVAVDFTVGGTAVAPGDYAAPTSRTLTIPPGQDTGTITIGTKLDGVLDPGETLSVTLSNPRTLNGGLAVLGSPATATVTIVDEQTVIWSVADVAIDESQDAVFTVTLDAAVEDDVTLTYATADGTATAGSDYTAVSNGRVTVNGGSREAKFTVQVADDSNGEASETFTVQLTRSNAPAGVEPPSATATATIRDNDLALLPIDDVTVTEGGQANIMLRLERMLQEPVLIGYSTAGSATAGMDYSLSVLGQALQLPQGAIPVPANVQQGVVTVSAEDDSLAEADEQFTLTLTTVNTDGSAPAVLGQVTVTIVDNDELSVSVTAPEAVAEGATAHFTVTVGGGESTAPVEVTYSLSGTAKAPADYTVPNELMVVVGPGQQTATIAIQTKTDKVLEPDETLVVTLTEASTTAGSADVGSPRSATTAIQDPVYHSLNRVNQTLLPGITRASAAGALEAVSARMALAAQGDPPAATADLAGLTGLYQALQANERALQDGSYDLAKVLGGSSFLVPLSSHDGAPGGGVGGAFWGGGDFRQIGGGASDDEDSVEWDGSVWSARLGADLRFVDSLLTGLAFSWTSGGLDYVDELAPSDREGTYASWLISALPYVGWTTPDFGLWASGGFGFGGVSIDDSDEDMEAQEADLTQWSLGAGASVTLLSTEGFIAGGTTDLKLKAEGFLAGASVSENEAKTIAQLDVGVNQARAAIEASHAQYFAGGGSLKPSLEIGGRFDGGDGETGAGIEVGGGLTYADPGSGLTVAAGGRALVIRDGNYGEWGLTGLIQLDPNAAGHGLMISVRPAFGVTASGVNGLWEHGTFDLLAGGQPGGRVEAEIGYGLPAFGMAGVLTPFAAGALTDAGAHSLSLGGRLELGPAFDLILEAARSDSANADTEPVYDVTLEGSIRW